MCNIEINGVSITLTKEQLELIDFQRNKITHYSQIKTYEDACKVLNKTPKQVNDYDELKEWYFHQLTTISKAINSLEYLNTFPNWNNPTKHYYPYFTGDDSGVLGFYCSFYDGSDFNGQVAYYVNKKSSNYAGKTFMDLYNKLLNC